MPKLPNKLSLIEFDIDIWKLKSPETAIIYSILVKNSGFEEPQSYYDFGILDHF